MLRISHDFRPNKTPFRSRLHSIMYTAVIPNTSGVHSEDARNGPWSGWQSSHNSGTAIECFLICEGACLKR